MCVCVWGGGGGAIFQIPIFKGVFRKINIIGDMKIFGGDIFGVGTYFDSFSVGIISILCWDQACVARKNDSTTPTSVPVPFE